MPHLGWIPAEEAISISVSADGRRLAEAEETVLTIRRREDSALGATRRVTAAW